MTEAKAERGQALFTTDTGGMTQGDILKTLREIGVEEGDILFIHSDITVFGKLAMRDRDRLLGSLVNSFAEVVGEKGTLLMPAFTYSFDRSETFDREKSRSTVGILTEFFRKQKDVGRTSHPSHSVAVSGKEKKFFLDISWDTFGEDSVFHKLRQKRAKLVFFGSPLRVACTFIHHIEQSYGVPYRYFKRIPCRILEEEKERAMKITLYYKYSYYFTDMGRLEEVLLDKGLLKQTRLGEGAVQIIDAEELFQEGKRLLGENIFFFLKDSPFLFWLFNRLSYPAIRFLPPLARLGDRLASRMLRRS